MLNLLCKISVFGWVSLIVIALVVITFITLVIIYVPLKIYFKCLTNNSKISLFKLAGLKQQNVDLKVLTDAYISVKKAGLFISLDELQTHLAAGGSLQNLINALVTADNSKIDMSVDLAKAIDLSGKNVFEVVKNSINPKVIESEEISAIAKDGIEIKLKAKVTIKAVLTKVIGGTGEDTILAKVAEGASAVIGALGDHKEVLQNPDIISKTILTKDIDKNSAYKVMSIEISNIDVGRNIGAQLRIDEIEVDKKLSNAKAEELRAKAVYQEQQLRIKAQEKKIERLSAEADIPKTIVKAIDEGKMSLMDYYKMQNIIADTNMRKSFTDSNISTDDD